MVLNGLKILHTMWLATPAAMNKPIPLPIPYLETTSSKYIKIIEPSAICSTTGINQPACGATSPPMTYANDSKKHNINANNFCAELKRALSFGLLKSTLIIFPPTNNCKIIDASTMGPIPTVIKVPILDAKMNCNVDNCPPADALKSNPITDTAPMTKKISNTPNVHFSRFDNEGCCSGVFTSGNQR